MTAEDFDRRRSDPVILAELQKLTVAVVEQNQTTARLADAIVDVNEIRRETTHLAAAVHEQGIVTLASAEEFHDARKGILRRVAVGLAVVVLGVVALSSYLVHVNNDKIAARNQSSRVSCEKRNLTGEALDAYFLSQIQGWADATVVPQVTRLAFIASNERARQTFRVAPIDCAKTYPGTVYSTPRPFPSPSS